jgi:dTDP-4-dehydrorhamnose reductase
MNNPYLIIGGSGYLGTYFIKNILKLYPNRKIIATYNERRPNQENTNLLWLKLDVCNQGDLLNLANEMKDTAAKFNVIYLSSYHHPDKVEQNPELGRQINLVALENIIKTLPNIASFYYASSDTVYGESINNYHFTESDAHNPVNEYGRQKSGAEKIVRQYGHNVIHYPFLIGPSLSGKPHFFDHIVNDLKAGKKFEAFFDSYRSSIDFNSATILTLQLFERNINAGTVNICSDLALSKYELIKQIAEKLGYNSNLIIPISIKETNGIFLAKRANSAMMNNSKIKELLNLEKININI